MSSDVRYRPVSTTENDHDRLSRIYQPASIDAAMLAREKRKRDCDRINSYIHAIGWLIASGFILHYTKMYEVITTDERLDRRYFSAGIVFSCVVVGAVGYLCLYLPYVLGVQSRDYNKVVPNAIYTMIISSMLTYCCFLASIWPIWGYVSLPILTVLSVATILFPVLIPSCVCP